MPRYGTKITSKGQVTIPRAVRERLGIEQGDYLVFEPAGDRFMVTKAPLAPTDDFEALAEGIAERFREQGVSREDVDEAIRWARRRS